MVDSKKAVGKLVAGVFTVVAFSGAAFADYAPQGNDNQQATQQEQRNADGQYQEKGVIQSQSGWYQQWQQQQKEQKQKDQQKNQQKEQKQKDQQQKDQKQKGQQQKGQQQKGQQQKDQQQKDQQQKDQQQQWQLY